MDGVTLRELRTRFGLTQVQVAAAAGIAQSELSAIENSRRGSVESHDRVATAIRSIVRPSDVLTDETRQTLLNVFAAHGAHNVRVFGSVARGADRPGSDLDLLAVFPERFGFLELMQMEEELEETLGLPVDVISDSPLIATSLVRAKREAVAL